MKDIIEAKKVRLSIKSPIHIGSVDQKLTPFDYIEDSRYVYHISEEKLSKFLLKRNLINLYLSAVQRDGYRFRIREFLRENTIKLKESELMWLSGGRKIRIIGDAARLTDFRPFIRDGFGKVYIPGTSIKGVIRTAILYRRLKRLKEKNINIFTDSIVKRIKNTPTDVFKKRSPFLWLQEEFLQNFELLGKTKTPHTDWLRILHISDAYPINSPETKLIALNVLKKGGNKWIIKKLNSGQNMLIWTEVVPEGTIFEFNIALDKSLMRKFKEIGYNDLPENLDDLILCINEWTSDIKNHEKEFFKGYSAMKWYNTTETLNFRIGFGSGMISTTVTMLLPEDLKKKIRNICGKNKGNEIAPKSRRVWIKDKESIPLGWAVLEVV